MRGAEVERHRGRLYGLAYRMLGVRAQAEDVVQEAFARWYAAPRDDVRSVGAFLTTMVTNLCLDHLKSGAARHESYVGPWLPEPIATREADEAALEEWPGGQALPVADAESISFAFVTLLETLSPMERAVYLLREVFEYSHAEVAAMLGRSEAAVRQAHHRAREAVRARRPRFAPDRAAHERLVTTFLSACRNGDFDTLHAILARDAIAHSDGGGKAPALTRPLAGGPAVAKLFVGFLRAAPPDLRVEVREVNGRPALAGWSGGTLRTVLSFETDGERIHGIYSVLNPDKLAWLASAWEQRP